LADISIVLVVAPDSGFRRSIEFALGAEGYGIDSQAQLSTAITSPMAPLVCCAIIDEDAIKNWTDAWQSLKRFPKPIVLLVDRPWPPPEPDDVKILVKPLLGSALVETVRHVVISTI
jgi:hypothetical protein